MDQELTFGIIIFLIFALIVIIGIFVYPKFKARIQGPFNFGLEINGSNDSDDTSTGVEIKNVESRKGGILAEDQTGRGVKIEQAEVESDIIASSSQPNEEADPKS